MADISLVREEISSGYNTAMLHEKERKGINNPVRRGGRGRMVWCFMPAEKIAPYLRHDGHFFYSRGLIERELYAFRSSIGVLTAASSSMSHYHLNTEARES